MPRFFPEKTAGFTLAELLIALFILGVIASFTIPKVLVAQQNSAYKAKAKEALAIVAEGVAALKLNNTFTSATSPKDLLPYLNYVSVVENQDIDHIPGMASVTCEPLASTSGQRCVKLHNGAVMAMNMDNRFGGTESNRYIYFFFDPDGVYSNTTDGPGKSITIDIYYNGRVNTSTEREAGDLTNHGGGDDVWGADPAPDWFTW